MRFFWALVASLAFTCGLSAALSQTIITRGAGSSQGFGFPKVASVAANTIVYIDGGFNASCAATFTLPANVLDNDIGIFSDISNDGVSATTPSGWTQIGSSQVTGNLRSVMSFRVLTASLASTTVTGMTDVACIGKRWVTLRPSGGTWGAAASVNQQATTGNQTSQTVTVGAAPLFIIGSYASTGLVNPRTFSPAATGEIGSGTSWIKYGIYNSSPSNTSVDMDDEGTGNILNSWYIPLGP